MSNRQRRRLLREWILVTIAMLVAGAVYVLLTL